MCEISKPFKIKTFTLSINVKVKYIVSNVYSVYMSCDPIKVARRVNESYIMLYVSIQCHYIV